VVFVAEKQIPRFARNDMLFEGALDRWWGNPHFSPKNGEKWGTRAKAF